MVGGRQVKVLTASILMGLLAVAASGAAEPNAPPQEKRSGWEALNLIKTTISGTPVYYEKGLEPNLPIFERELKKVLADREKVSPFLEKKSLVVADINRIVGPSDIKTSDQERMLTTFLGLLAGVKLTPYLVKMSTMKDYLRAGGQLPDSTYNRQDDTVLYQPKVHLGQESFDLCLPIPADMEFGKYVSGILARFRGGDVGTAIHEVTEMTLMTRARPTDPYWRWFSDGFANAITENLLEKYVGREEAEKYVAGFSTEEHRALENQINLRYWMMANFYPCKGDLPVTRERDIEYARYAYATFEAKRLIDANGIDCVRKIVDRIAAKEPRKGSDLLEVIKEVTGQDMAARMARYQTFETVEQGIPKYTSAFEAAQKLENWGEMIISVLRITELRGDIYSANNLQSFGNIALFLFKMGNEKAGDEVMRHAIDLFAKSPIEHGREAAMEMFMLYAIQCHHPAKAEKEADELLRLNPQASMPLTIKMLTTLERGNLAEARSLAGQIQSRANEQSAPYKMAAQVLAIDPNRPNTYNRTP